MSMFRSGRLQHHQLARIPHRQPPQQHLIEQGEDRRVCTDAQRERHNGNEAKTRIFREHSHLQSSAGTRRDFLAGTEKRESSIPKRARRATHRYFRRIRSKLSQADMSERITLSPTFNPSRSSTVFTELRPNLTLTRTASDPSSMILKIPIVLFSCPCTGRPT